MTTKMTKMMIALGAMTVAGAAMAATSAPATMGVSATISNTCSVGNTAALQFGDIQMLAAGSHSNSESESTGGGTFDAICTNGTLAPQFKFTSANTWFNDYRLKGADGTTHLPYTLVTSLNTALPYGTPVTFTDFVANGTTISLRIKGVIAASDKMRKGVQMYSDTITITAFFTP